MSAVAFHLSAPGTPAPCGYPGCIAGAFHEGEHQFAALKAQFPLPSQYNRTCCECGRRFVVLIDSLDIIFRTCGAQGCLMSLAKRESPTLPVTCNCAQRPYPHELIVHRSVKFESRVLRWPWSLRFAPDMEAA